MHRYVDIHLIVDPFDRQFNMWRNVAKFFVRTDYLMMLDVDFHLCTDFRHRILNDPDTLFRLDSGRAALVVPAFEYVVQEDGLDAATFPTTKTDLVNEALDQEKIDMFHKSWLNGHGATNYSHWYASSDLYKVTDYNFSYEPYVIFKKEGSPWCDERFIGYGANKAACLYEIYLAGIEYWVLPNDFLIHQTHSYPEGARRKEVSTRVTFMHCMANIVLFFFFFSVNTTGNCTATLEKNFVYDTPGSLWPMANGIAPWPTISSVNVERSVGLDQLWIWIRPFY